MKMRWSVVVLAALALLFPLRGGEEAGQAAAKPDEKAAAPAGPVLEGAALREKASYAIGLNIGKNLKNQGVELDLESFVKGVKESLSGAKPTITEKEMRDIFQAFQKEVMAKQAEKAKVAGEKNQIEGEAFLADNKSKPGVQTLPSGLQYKILKEGTGPKPKATDSVTTHYKGTLIDGTEFDSSYSRGEPAQFRVNGVIKGWTEALQLMPVGSQWKLCIPSDLAYGERQAGPQIGPNSTLTFDVTLVSIKSSEKPAGAASQPIELK